MAFRAYCRPRTSTNRSRVGVHPHQDSTLVWPSLRMRAGRVLSTLVAPAFFSPPFERHPVDFGDPRRKKISRCFNHGGGRPSKARDRFLHCELPNALIPRNSRASRTAGRHHSHRLRQRGRRPPAPHPKGNGPRPRQDRVRLALTLEEGGNREPATAWTSASSRRWTPALPSTGQHSDVYEGRGAGLEGSRWPGPCSGALFRPPRRAAASSSGKKKKKQQNKKKRPADCSAPSGASLSKRRR